MFMFALVTSLLLHAAGPIAVWTYEAESNLYAPPLAVDLHPAPGLETVLSDAEARALVCLDAQGQVLWRYAPGWGKRLTSGAAYTAHAGPAGPALAIGNPDGTLACIDAVTGAARWRQAVGPIEWGNAVWADLDGDGTAEIIAGTRQRIVALSYDGTRLWQYPAQDQDEALDIQGPIAAADADGDGRAEVFAVDLHGPLALRGDGHLLWHRPQTDWFASAPIVADADGDGTYELYAASRLDGALHAFDALDGAVRWRVPLHGDSGVYAGAGMAAGDLDGDGALELIVPDETGHVHAIDQTGALRWVFSTRARTHAAVTLGDVDGDGAVDVLVAGGDRTLYVLDAGGRHVASYSVARRLISPATIADVDGDGRTDVLVGGSGRVLHCLTFGGRYDAARVPWPARRGNPAQQGVARADRETTVAQAVALLDHGGFNRPKVGTGLDASVPEAQRIRPQGWTAESPGDVDWRLDGDVKTEGAAAVRVGPRDAAFALGSDWAETTGLTEVAGEIYGKGAGLEAAVVWHGSDGHLRSDPLASESGPDGWQWFQASGLTPPHGARWVKLVCSAAAGKEPVWWDAAALTGMRRERRTLNVVVNQVGYDTGAPKRFVVLANFDWRDADFELVDGTGQPVYTARLEAAGRITGRYGHDWGHAHWRGDFTAFDTPGRYRIRVAAAGADAQSPEFQIGENLLWRETAELAYQFFYYQRCGTAVPGFHGPCHLDDSTGADGVQYPLSGGWHDAGDYNKYHNAPYVSGLAAAYRMAPEAFAAYDRNGNGLADFLDEILWGADFSRRMVAEDGSARGRITTGYGFWGPPELETDNLPATGDERPLEGGASGLDPSQHLAATARVARIAPHNAGYVEAAERALGWMRENGRGGLVVFTAALDLHAATGGARYAALAQELLPEPSVEAAAALQDYDAQFGTDHGGALREAFIEHASHLLAMANNPYGVYTFGSPEEPNFFNTPPDEGGWHVGTSSHLLNAAARMAHAYAFNPDPRYLAFIYDQFNWTLGCNPYGISLMEGAGTDFLPSYHHRYAFAGVDRGAVPGGVVNGITWRAVGDDRPSLDLSGLDIPAYESNEVWLPHNTAYIEALVRLHRARP